MSFLDAGLERCEVVVGEILLRGVVVVAVSAGLEVVDSIVLFSSVLRAVLVVLSIDQRTLHVAMTCLLSRSSPCKAGTKLRM